MYNNITHHNWLNENQIITFLKCQLKATHIGLFLLEDSINFEIVNK